MEIIPTFISFIATDMLALDNERIEKFCRALKQTSAGRVVSNAGGWQSTNLDLEPLPPDLQPLFAEIARRLSDLHRHFNFSDTMQQSITEAWVNINGKGSVNYTHNHPGKMFSCVYYVKGGTGKGGIEFDTPIQAHAYTISAPMVSAYNAFTAHAMQIPPVTGQLLIFPSWLHHHVKQNETDEDRISIAINTDIVKK